MNDNEKAATENGGQDQEVINVPATVITQKQENDKSQETSRALAVSNSMPQLPTNDQIDAFGQFLDKFDAFIGSQLKPEVDFTNIPNVDKPSLSKAGAEKLEKLFFLTHESIRTEQVIAEGYSFVKYTYQTVVRNKSGEVVATCEGTCNSKEMKYLYTTVFDNQATDEQKKQGVRIQKHGRNNSTYYVYRIEKKDFYDLENTIMKMAQKRSYVGAILLATGSSGRFTIDVEDLPNHDGHLNETAANNHKPAQRSPQSTRPNYQGQKPNPMSERQKKYITDLLKELGYATLAEAGINIPKPYQCEAASKAIDTLKDKIAKGEHKQLSSKPLTPEEQKMVDDIEY